MQRETTAPLYEAIGTGYAQVRRADPRIAQAIWQALGNVRMVVNVGAGAGNYEPTDRFVVAVEPARTMLAQRATTQAPAVQAVLDAYEVNQRIVWRAELGFLCGTHAFEVQDAGAGATLVRHVVRADLAWWFVPVWRLYMSGAHDRIMRGLLDRLAAGSTRNEAST